MNNHFKIIDLQIYSNLYIPIWKQGWIQNFRGLLRFIFRITTIKVFLEYHAYSCVGIHPLSHHILLTIAVGHAQTSIDRCFEARLIFTHSSFSSLYFMLKNKKLKFITFFTKFVRNVFLLLMFSKSSQSTKPTLLSISLEISVHRTVYISKTSSLLLIAEI